MAVKNRATTPFGEIPVLVLQGGGALGAYQGGVYAELAAREFIPKWIAGISIGAINAAIIAGNAPGQRVEALRTFWDTVSSTLLADPPGLGRDARALFNESSAGMALMFGIPGFFTPRTPPALFSPPGSPNAISYYDTAPLRKTLVDLIDFDRLNNGDTRISLGAVNVRTGNFAYFDSDDIRIKPEHIMASGALPPGFPPVEIDGEHFWDGGLVSNTPLQYVIDNDLRDDLCIFQVDLFSARGVMPGNLFEVADREKDIRFSSRTRLNTDVFRRTQIMRRTIHRLLEKLPAELHDDPDVQLLQQMRCDNSVTIVHLINRRRHYQSQSRDYEFSRVTVREHWLSGEAAVRHTLQNPAWINRSKPEIGVHVLDLANSG